MGIAWLIAFFTSGMVTVETPWTSVDVKLMLRGVLMDLYPGTSILSIHSITRMTWTKFFWTADRLIAV